MIKPFQDPDVLTMAGAKSRWVRGRERC